MRKLIEQDDEPLVAANSLLQPIFLMPFLNRAPLAT